MIMRSFDRGRDVGAVSEFIDGAVARGAFGLSENKASYPARDDGRSGAGIVVESGGGRVVGYAGMAPANVVGEWALEIVADPEDVDVGSLVAAATHTARELNGLTLRWWVYEPELREFPPQLGFDLERRLLRMARDLPPEERASFPDRYRVTSFRPGVDEADWIGANNAAFAGHHENGDLTRADLDRRMAMPWFDPRGLRMAWDGDELAGFCWTKVHDPGSGEIYIIGAVPEHQGRGLGRPLVVEGMRHLADAGCSKVFLYCEGDNHPAVRLYQGLGFETERVHEAFVRSIA